MLYKGLRMLLIGMMLMVGVRTVQAQLVTGFVKDAQLNYMANVSVIVKNVKNGAVVKVNITDTAGKYVFESLPRGTYFIHTTHVGYEPGKSAQFNVDSAGNVMVPDLIITRAAVVLKEVNITAKPPLVEMKHGMLVLNVESNINSIGQNVLEILSKAPAVMVNRDEMISISGKRGVRVYIDGRSVPLGGKDLSEYLKTIQAANVQNIEIILNPSAKYDAAGNAGIINIKLKKNDAMGTNGSVNAGYNIATYPRINGNVNLNHRDRKFNLYGNIGFRHTTNESFQTLQREVLDTLFDQNSRIKSLNKSITYRSGIDYTISKNHSFGVMVDGVFGDNIFESDSRTPISYLPTKQVSRILTANNNSNGFMNMINVNGNYRFADTKGHELIIDANYATFNIGKKQYQPNIFYDASGTNAESSSNFRIHTGNDLEIRNFKGDYELNFLKGKLELGTKSSFVTSDNDFRFFEEDRFGNDQPDTSRSNLFNYKENINAAYASYRRGGKAWEFQMGLRVENSIIKGKLSGFRLKDNQYNVYDTAFTRNYTDPFPNVSITYKKNPNKQWSLNLGRRIDRPVYQNLNPFEARLDAYSFQKGNPELKPQYTYSIGLTFMYKFKLITMLNYSHVAGVFTQFTDTADKSKIFITFLNLSSQNVASLNISYPLKFRKYSLFVNANTFYTSFKAGFGAGRTINNNAIVYKINTVQGLDISKTWSTQLTIGYNSAAVTQGTYKDKSTWFMDLGLQKSLFKKVAMVRLAVSDIFYTLPWRTSSNFSGQLIKANGRTESRQLMLYFFCNLGNAKLKAIQQRKGADEETKRVRTN